MGEYHQAFKNSNLFTEFGFTEGLKKNNTVKISGFGTFKLRKKKSRTGRNPMTGKKYQIKSRNVVTFHPSQIVKKIINNEK